MDTNIALTLVLQINKSESVDWIKLAYDANDKLSGSTNAKDFLQT